jgi:Domain of unknown function (DUF4270)
MRLSFKQVLISIGLLNFVLIGCTKIEKTTMGGDLIPAVDNVTTFDTILDVVSNNYIPQDSTRLNAGNDHMIGGIADDPQFGKTSARMFFELKPPNYPFLFESHDSIMLFDSAVLVLKYQGHYGDSSDPVNFKLYQTQSKIEPDLTVVPKYTLKPGLTANYSILWGEKTMRANQYDDTVYIKRGEKITSKVINQLRIPLNKALAEALFKVDTNNIYKNDSTFESYLPGFALEAQGSPKALHYFLLTSTDTKLEFYYRAKRGGELRDTISRSFVFNANCGHAVDFKRDHSGAEINDYLVQNPTSGVPQVYIQGTPGTMATIDIPGLKTLSNRVLHRVELRVTEITENSGAYSQLTAPAAIYLDGEYENEPGNFRGIPYDLNPFGKYYCYPATGVDFAYFGGTRKSVKIDGDSLNRYTFNITRYVQSMITRNEPSFKLRLSAPFYMVYKDCSSGFASYPSQVFPFQTGGVFWNQVGESRIRVAGGNHPDEKLRMQVRVIYSKL